MRERVTFMDGLTLLAYEPSPDLGSPIRTGEGFQLIPVHQERASYRSLLKRSPLRRGVSD